MGNYFDVHATIGGMPAEFKVVVEDYNELGTCYLVYYEGNDLGYFCRLPDGNYKAIDRTQLTQQEIQEIGDLVEGIKGLRVAS
jgi:hypothetical protein